MLLGANVRILVADESAIMRDVMRTVLRSLNHPHVVEAASGMAALRSFRGDDPPRLAFIDSALAGPGALAVLRRIRLEYPNTFVVMVSGGHAAADLKAAIENGADAFLVKPYRLSKVEHALDKYYEISPRLAPTG